MMVDAVSSGGGDPRVMEEAASEIEAAAAVGYPHAQSALGFMYNMGMMRAQNRAEAFIYHCCAADGGNLQSKMALAYTYLCQNMSDKAVKLYAELAEVTMNSIFIRQDSLIRIYNGAEENKDLRKFRGEKAEDFKILEDQAQKGDAGAMYRIGIFYRYGLKGVRRDYAKALSWLLNAVEKGEPRPMVLLGEIYTRGAGVERNYTKAMEWFTLASRQQLYSAYTWMGYLYVKGYGVERNYTKAKEYFKKAAGSKEPGASYFLGLMYLKGIGVKKDLRLARWNFAMAVNEGHQVAIYQLAKMYHTGVGLRKNLRMAINFYRTVAEWGPWSSLSRWALESYLKGDVGKAFFLYSRMAELGYEVAQSNAAWILDKYGERSMCIGESGLCTDAERHKSAHSLWWLASQQGNEDANNHIQMSDEAVKLYAELAEVTMNSIFIWQDSLIRIYNGAEENKDLRKFHGEKAEDFKILQDQAQKGDAGAMYRIGTFYCYGLKGVRRDYAKALSWLLNAVEKGEPRSMVLLGEIFTRGAGVERNYTKAMEWFTLASIQQLYSAYTWMGYLYVKGYGVERNYTKAKEYFKKAAGSKEPGASYFLGLMYLKGIGVKKDLRLARWNFAMAVNEGHQEVIYQLAKMYHTGVGLRKNLRMAINFYRAVAEWGPWSSLSRWALESYLKGDVGKAFFLYSRMAELGYEVAQSNAAWILDKYGERSMCIGESGLCTDAERHKRAHSLWWLASQQGSEDANNHIQGTERDGRAAEVAYMGMGAKSVECGCHVRTLTHPPALLARQ